MRMRDFSISTNSSIKPCRLYDDFTRDFSENIGKYRKIKNIEIANLYRGDGEMRGKRQISPRKSSKGVIDHLNKLWQFNFAILRKGSKHGKKIHSI